MPVRPEVVRSKIVQLGEAVGRLRSWLPVSVERLERDVMLRWAVLVHDYATVDVRRVHAGLARLDDFEAFVADVEAWLARSGR